MTTMPPLRAAIVRLRSALTQPNHAVGRGLSSLRADCRAGASMMIIFLMMTMILFVAFSLDALNMMTAAQRLNQAAQMAALAGGNTLKTYYSTGSTATLTAASNSLFTADSTGGFVHNAAAVTSIGTWSNKSFTATTTSPNAVRVTATGMVNTFFGTLLGKPSYPMTKTAVATVGGAKPVNVILVNDTSGSFSGDITQQRAADVAILNCIASSAKASSMFGIVTFDGTSTTYIPMTTVTAASKATLTTKINAMLSCSGNGSGTNPPRCSGSNTAAGIYNARTTLDALKCPTCNNNIVVITDGVPNFNSSVSYTQATGTYVTTATTTTGTGKTAVTTTVGSGSATTPICGVGSKVTCGSQLNSLGDPMLMLYMAQGQAAAAGASNYLVSTIYYSGDTSGSTAIAAYTKELAGWTRNGGVAMVAPTPTQITSSSGGVCSLLGIGLASTSPS